MDGPASCHPAAVEVEQLAYELSPPKPARADANNANDVVTKHHKRCNLFNYMLSGWSCWRFVLLLIDNVISGIFIGPLTVFYWHGTWTLLERHWFPIYQVDSDGHEKVVASAINGWICFIVGNVGILILVLAQNELSQRLKVDRLVHWLIGCHIYTYTLAFFNVCHWRGIWILLNVYTGVGATSVWTTIAIGLLGLWFLRSSCNATAPPMIVVVDLDPTLLQYTTRFNTEPKKSERYILDVVLTVFVIHQLVVFYWRGTWTLLDLHLFPADKTISAVVSLAASYVLQVILCIAQPFFNVAYRRQTNSCQTRTAAAGVFQDSQPHSPNNANFCRRFVLEATVSLVGNMICVAHWRGIWMLLDTYVLPDQPDVGAALTHVVGIVGLWMLLAGHSITLRGCSLDGGSKPDTGCLVRNGYVRYFVDRFKDRKKPHPDGAIPKSNEI